MGTGKAKWGCGCGREITQIRRFKWTHKLINYYYYFLFEDKINQVNHSMIGSTTCDLKLN